MHKIFYSISKKPGMFGTKIYNYFFDLYDIKATYKAVGIQDKNDFYKLVDLFIKTEMIDGLSISMPFKTLVFNYLNEKNILSSPSKFHSLNCVKKDLNNRIKGDLTDYKILEEFFKFYTTMGLSIKKFYIIGSGSMAFLSKLFLKERQIDFEMINRHNLKKFDFSNLKVNKYSGLINATPIDLESVLEIKNIQFPVLDFPVRIDFRNDNPLIFNGYKATKIQFRHQFEFYLNKKITLEEIDKACKLIF